MRWTERCVEAFTPGVNMPRTSSSTNVGRGKGVCVGAAVGRTGSRAAAGVAVAVVVMAALLMLLLLLLLVPRVFVPAGALFVALALGGIFCVLTD